MTIVEKKISDLKDAEYNPRILTEKQHAEIKTSLSKFGFVDPIIVNTNPDRMNVIIGGHQRVKVWAGMGRKTVPAVELDLTLDQERELNIRLNKNTGAFDFDILANEFEIEDLLNFGFEEWEFGIGKADEEEKQPKQEKEVKKLTIESDDYRQLLEMYEIASDKGLKCKLS